MDISVVIVGAAGQGVQTVEEFLVGILKMSGYHVFATKEYMSRVRGGMNSTELRIATNRVASYVQRIDLLIPFHKQGLNHLKHRISSDTMILGDDEDISPEFIPNPAKVYKLPLMQTAISIGDKIYANIVAVGAISALFGAAPNLAEKYLNQKFSRKGLDIMAKNIEAFKQGFQMGINLPGPCKGACEIDKSDHLENEIILSGVEAIGFGALVGGCNFIASYPMSPSTGLLNFLAKNAKDFGIVVDQAEDEISAMNKVIAAWYTGARAIVSTAGGGFALMTEAVSLAGMLETPVVIHVAQRPGPATGLPTRTAQEDLNLVLYAGHGEFPRIIFAPGTLEEAFYLTQKAFNLADKYQVPVFILSDQYFVDSYYNISEFDLSKCKVENAFIETSKGYKRYLLTEDGISPRGIPGFGQGVVRVDSDEHDEMGHITEDLQYYRPKMVEKRLMKKLESIKHSLDMPIRVGDENASILIICWGSNYHIVKEAIQVIGRNDLAMLHFHQLYPLASEILPLLQKTHIVLSVENNATGQFAHLIKQELDFSIVPQHQLRKYNGEPFAVEEVISFLLRIIESEGGNL